MAIAHLHFVFLFHAYQPLRRHCSYQFPRVCRNPATDFLSSSALSIYHPHLYMEHELHMNGGRATVVHVPSMEV
jgi:hypothetical protein